MRTLLQILILSFGLISIAKSQSQARFINQAYKQKSEVMLRQFCDKWADEYSMISDSIYNYSNDTIKEVYKVFLGFSQSFDSLYNNQYRDKSKVADTRYYLIQTRLNKIYFSDRIYFNKYEVDSIILSQLIDEYDEDTVDILDIYQDEKGCYDDHIIKEYGPRSDSFPENKPRLYDFNVDFYPITQDKNRILYLTGDYYDILNDFLYRGNLVLKRKSIQKRYEFIQSQIMIDYWQLLPSSYVYSLTFDQRIEYAEIIFKYGYFQGSAILKKIDNVWFLIEIKRLDYYKNWH